MVFAAGIVGGLFALLGLLGWMQHREKMQELRNARPDQ
jgi:hypothetical protein